MWSDHSAVFTDQTNTDNWQDFGNFPSHQKDQSLRVKIVGNETVVQIQQYQYDISTSTDMEIVSDSGEDLALIPTTVRGMDRNEVQDSDSHQNTSNSRNINSSSPCRQHGNIRLWQFLLNLLSNPAFNPSHIMWINQSVGEFKIVKNKEIAQMWGDVKNNSGMNYANMSRGIRYYYKRKIMEPVSKRRLVYKFGPKSHGWGTSS
ncbi:ETS homologous factor-like [Mytilus californianus]|uniref:ETS homologous factor-like n=1 Tax=Mytilus californianus TaxID=6549 RepID=UPI002248672D|nr:ETS homologous factor-like [Mytilus californianus]XP_052064350.1 ETS homologous factor-like [Mytilus californianus]